MHFTASSFLAILKHSRSKIRCQKVVDRTPFLIRLSLKIQGLGLWIQGLDFRVQGVGCRV
jgi:hypothetical protein